MAIEPPITDKPLPDGIYIGLDDKVYFAQDRLGSSDLIKLHFQKEGWWWSSRWNPDRKQEQGDAQNYGSALHAIMLEGLSAYETRFVVAPDEATFKGLLTTTPEIKNAITEAGIALKGTSGWVKADWCDAAALHLPGVPVWDNIMADFEKRREIRDRAGELIGKRPSVGAVEDRMLRFMLEAALEDGEIRQILGAGNESPALAELSFFWTDDRGVRRRARFDKPVPMFTLDLKSLGNWQGRELKHAVGDHALKYGYDIQVGDQHDARIRMHAMIRELGDDAIHGGTEDERAWLKAIGERNLEWEWVWLFYQKPEPSGRAPILFPLWESWGGPYHKSGFRKARKAIDFYLEVKDRFGLGPEPAASGAPSRPWSRVEPIHYVEEGFEPRITLPHYGWDEIPVAEEEEHLAR